MCSRPTRTVTKSRPDRPVAVVDRSGEARALEQLKGREATTWVVVGALPLFFITTFSSEQVSLTGRALTWIPLTSPVAVLLRLGSRSIAGPEIAAALALTLLCAAAALLVSSTLLRRVTIAGAR